jgi:lipopolysaccharide/colanic/teichoic acid biosynthesis glycosyltransferase
VIGRVFNTVTASMALMALTPVLLGISLAIKIEDGGPAFFSQERIGSGGKRFKCHKFRTMFEDAESLLMKWKNEDHPNWQRYVASNFKLQNDPRVTRIGRFLRRTSLDEVPQLINVLIGEMNLVGPRPLLEREIPDYGMENFEKYKAMIPGLTGLWQVSGRSNTTFKERAELDINYFEQRNWLMDLKIMVKTISVLCKRTGAY